MDIRTVKKYLALETDKLSKNVPQKNHEVNVNKKEENINAVRSLKENEYGIKQVARVTGLSKQTVREYLKTNISAVHGSYGVTRECSLVSFHSIIDELITKDKPLK